MGEFMGYMPLTVIIVLTASLFVALVIVPVATATLMKAPKTARTEGELPPENELMGKVLRAYRSILGWSIDHRYISLAGGFLSLIVTFVLYGMFRYLFLLHRRAGGGDPAAQLLNDRHLLAACVGWLFSILAVLA